MNELAILLGDEPRVSLTVARSLRRCVVLVDLFFSDSPAALSRLFRRVHRVPHPGHDFASYASSVLRCLQQVSPTLIVPCSDTALHLVMEHQAEVARCGCIAAPGPDALRAILDKDATMRIAEQLGVPVPITYDVPTLNAARAMRDQLRFPVIAKPRSKAGRPARFKVKYFDSFAELEAEFLGDEWFGETYLVQECVAGHGVGIGTVIVDGDAVAWAQHRRLTESPPTGGVAVSAVSEELDPVLAEHSLRLLRAIGWSGVAMVEFKRSEAGRAVLMEVNGRFWGSVALTVQSGVDVPRYVWEAHRGERPPAPRLRTRKASFCWSAGELRRAQQLWQAGAGTAAASRAFAAFGVHLLTARGHPVFRLTDPVPAMLELSAVARDLVRGIIATSVRAMLPAGALRVIRESRRVPASVRSTYLRRAMRRALGIPAGRPSGPVRSVLLVCHGNIMRSAYAEARLRSLVDPAAVNVLSAGVAAKDGTPAAPDAIRVASARGVDLENHGARRLTRELVNRADAILVMDFANEARLLAEFPDAAPRVALLGTFGNEPGADDEIADPYNQPLAVVEQCFSSIDRPLSAVVEAYDLARNPVGSPRGAEILDTLSEVQ